MMVASGSRLSSLSLVNWIENLAPTKGGSNFSMMLSGQVSSSVETALSKIKFSM
jgi:hypothetical protein